MGNGADKRLAGLKHPQGQGLAMHEEITPPDTAAMAMNELLMDRGALHFSEFSSISDGMMDGYAHFVRLGLPGHTVALAMLGGALNLYDMFGLRASLPELLRNVADSIDARGEVN